MLVFATSDKGGTGRSVTSSNVAYRRALQGSDVCYLGDPAGNLIGDVKALWLHRLVTATKTINTRRL